MKFTKINVPLRIKLAVPVASSLAALLLMLYIYVPRQYERTLVRAYTKEAIRSTELLAGAVGFALDAHSFEFLLRVLQSVQADADVKFVLVVDEQGSEVATYNPTDLDVSGLAKPTDSVPQRTDNIISVTRPILGAEKEILGKLVLGYSLDELHATIRKDKGVAVVFASLSFVLGLLFINRISARMSRSLSELDRQMHKTIESGSYSSNLAISSNDEVGRLTADFNRMMEELRLRHDSLAESQRKYRNLNQRLRKLNKLKTMFVSDASHHLRTPLTIIKGEIEVALLKKRSLADYTRVLKIVAEETDHLSKIVENLLTLAKADAGNLVVLEDAVDISRVLSNQIDHVRILAEKKNIVIEQEIENKCLVLGDPHRLAEVFFNLLENAIKYSPEGQKVSASLQGQMKNIVIRVTDTGSGIPAEDTELLFDRFYRGGNSRRAPGTGLGLAICKSIVEAHRGDMHVTSKEGKGSTFEVHIRRWSAPDKHARLRKKRKLQDNT